MNSSDSRGSPDAQSLSLSGMPAPSRADLRRADFRASWAATRARWALIAFWTILLPSDGCSSSHSANLSLVVRWTNDLVSTLPSFDLV